MLSLARDIGPATHLERALNADQNVVCSTPGCERLIKREEGQDLIEYALVVALIAFAAVAAMQALAVDINAVFTAIGTALAAAG